MLLVLQKVFSTDHPKVRHMQEETIVIKTYPRSQSLESRSCFLMSQTTQLKLCTPANILKQKFNTSSNILSLLCKYVEDILYTISFQETPYPFEDFSYIACLLISPICPKKLLTTRHSRKLYEHWNTYNIAWFTDELPICNLGYHMFFPPCATIMMMLSNKSKHSKCL